MAKKATELQVEDIVQTGLPTYKAKVFYEQLQQAILQAGAGAGAGGGGTATTLLWHEVSKQLLEPNFPHALHQLMYYSIYRDWDISQNGPPIAWFPTLESARCTNLGRLLEAHGPHLLGTSYYNPITSFPLFHQFSVDNPEVYISLVLKELSIFFHVKPRCILDRNDTTQPGGTWFPGSVINVSECCLLPKHSINKFDESIAIVWRDEADDDLPVNKMTLRELRARVMRTANALDAVFSKGDAVAIDMPMTVDAVVIYLALVLAGYVVVAIADSFVPQEIATRLRVSKAKGIFTQDFIKRGGKKIPLYSRVVEACAPKAIVVPAKASNLGVQLRDNDISWFKFLSFADHVKRPEIYTPVLQSIDSWTAILFSSGTSAEPKAIPWTNAAPIRIGIENWAHLDLKSGDTFCWPTNLGWVVGHIGVYASFLSGATLALYHGSPLERGFGKFVQDAGVTLLGTVPTIVKTWKNTGCMEGLDWSSIRRFSSVGEASNIDDDLWLSSKAWYQPVLECCGATELAFAFAQSCLVQPQAFGMFSIPSMTTEFVLLDENQIPHPNDQPCVGEVGLVPKLLGASFTLLNADHHAIYFKGMPSYKGMTLRRQGDMMERTVGGYYRALGRCDDAMNLGGIKTSAIEIERVCNGVHKGIIETAAISIPPEGGGPEKLCVLAILKDGANISTDDLRSLFSKAIRRDLNPLFKVNFVKVVSSFPRTGTNKIMRRLLRENLRKEFSHRRSSL